MNRDWNWILSESQRLYTDGADTWTDISEELNVPRRTLTDGLRREFSVGSIEDLKLDDEPGPGIDALLARIKPFHPQAKKELSVISTEDAMLLLLSDFHFGACFDGDDLIPGYNSKLAAKYISNVFSEAVSVAQRMGVLKIYIAALGDMVDGTHLRIQHARETDLHLIDQVMGLVTIMATELAHLESLGFEVVVFGVPGNHARVQKDIGSGHPAENLDTLVYKFLEKYFENSSIRFVISDNWYLLEEVEGHGFLFTHGDEVRGAANPGKKISERARLYEQRLAVQRRKVGHALDLEYVVCGHFHTPITFPDLSFTVYVNGSVQTGSEFISHRLGKQNRPMQRAFILNHRDGVFAEFQIYADRNVD